MLVEAYWLLVLAACSVLLPFTALWKRLPKPLQLLASYGKNLQTSADRRWSWVFVPKTYFAMFYAAGLWWCLTLYINCLWASSVRGLPSDWVILRFCRLLIRFPDVQSHDQSNEDQAAAPSHAITSSECLLGLGLMVYQTTRRLYEQVVVLHSSASAKMVVHQFVFGMTFYFFVPLTILSGSPFMGDTEIVPPPWSASEVLRYLVAIGLFLWGSYHQYACHVILAKLRRPGDSKYAIPYGDWFEYVSSPHYLAEIVIYLALGVVVGWIMSWWLVVACVIGNLTVSAISTHRWYHENFPEYPHHRTAIVPWLL